MTDFSGPTHHRQLHQSPMQSYYQRPARASTASEYLSTWQHPVTAVNHASDSAESSQYCGFADQRQAVIGKNRQHVDHSTGLKWEVTNGFETETSVQHGFVGGQQLQPRSGVNQNQPIVCETAVLDMNQAVNMGADRQQRMCGTYQQPDTIADCQQAAGFAGRRPRQFIQHSVSISPQPVTVPNAPTSYENASVIQPNQSFAVQQQQVAWSCSHSYTQTGCTFLMPYYHKVGSLIRHTAYLAWL